MDTVLLSMTRLCPEAPQHSASLAPGPHPVASMGPRSPRLCPSHYRCPFRSHCLCPAASVMPCDPLEENRLCVSAAGAAGYLWKQTPLNHFPLHPVAESVCVGEALSFTSLFAPTEAVCLFLAAAVCPKLVLMAVVFTPDISLVVLSTLTQAKVFANIETKLRRPILSLSIIEVVVTRTISWRLDISGSSSQLGRLIFCGYRPHSVGLTGDLQNVPMRRQGMFLIFTCGTLQLPI
ncbi:hypothetical protein XENOCAPTIV_024087 [Xenoophorus captivus]|uniref:Uncharacterized protein n=1 Tax=Xenoophorus captivus TaxID=1517983 RepID=A0ABV0RND3_9TELE